MALFDIIYAAGDLLVSVFSGHKKKSDLSHEAREVFKRTKEGMKLQQLENAVKANDELLKTSKTSLTSKGEKA